MKIFYRVILIIFLFADILKAQSDDQLTNRIGNFTAKIKKGEVNLNWAIINPSNLYKFKVEIKKAGTELFTSLSDIMFTNFRKKEESDTLTMYYYIFSHEPEENGVYFYKVNAFDLNNKIVRTEEIKIGITEVPEFKLHQNNPNPFNPSTIITYNLLVPTEVKLRVYSLTGKFVDVLVDEFQAPGTYNIEFNAVKYSEISSGIYFYKLETNYTSDIKKMIFTK